MIKLGRVLRHLEGKEEVIVRSKQAPKIGEEALDGDGKIIGEISDVFGPVDGPYAVIRLTQKKKDISPVLKSKKVFLEEKREKK